MSNMFLNVVSTFKGDGITSATRQLNAFGRQTSSFGSVLGKAATALASFGLAAKGIQFGRQSIEQARDLERNLYALDTIFGSLAPGMREFAKNAEDIGLSQSKAAKASTFIGSVLKQSGFEMSAVAEETENLVRLGTDLAALYGYDVQEALLGMTALFRGEYDPIEKFGVAMKQSEINSELAARGQDKLQGAARRNAEQTVRLELLYQRAADAMGAFEGQSGSLYTEQKKLGATFENMQAQIGTALLPTVVDLNEQLRLMLVEATPGLISLFEFFGQVLEGLVGIFRDAMDPTTDLGESVAALGIQFESLLKTIFGQDFTLVDFFEGASAALGIFLDFMHDLLRIIENTIIGFQVMGEQLGLLFTGQWDKLLNFDAAGEIRKRIDFKDTIQANKLKVKEYIAEWDNARKLDIEGHNDSIGKTADAWERALRAKSNYLKPAGLTGSADSMERQLTREGIVIPSVGGTGTGGGGGGGGGGGAAAVALTGYQELQKGLVFEGKKAVLQAKLVGTNLAQGLVDKILTGKAPLKTAGKVLTDVLKKDGSVRNKAVTNLNNQFAATYSEVNRIAQESARAGEAAAAASIAAAQEAERQAEELRRAEEARIEGLNQLYANFLETIKGTFAGIRNAIQGAFDITGLGGSTNAILRNMDKLLNRLKSFSANVKSLATMGLDPALLQQIITAGPMAGARIASALVAGGAGALGAINAGFGQVGSLASEIAQTGVSSLFDTQKQQNVYNITVTGGVGSGSTIGKAIVDAIKDYERTSGAVWQGA
jgi:hypothetical protein